MYIYTRIHMFTDVYMYTDPTSNPTPINIWHVPHNPTLTPLLYTKRQTIYIHILQRIYEKISGKLYTYMFTDVYLYT